MKYWPILLVCAWLFVACQEQSSPPAPTDTQPTAVALVATETSPTDTPTSLPPTATATSLPPTSTPTAVPTNTPTPTATPISERALCFSQEPRSLYFYNDYSPIAHAIRQALYEPLYTTLDFQYQAQGLSEIPTVENGGVVLETVTVSRGAQVVNAQGQRIPLRTGDTIRNAAGELQTYGGEGSVQMVQMRVNFTFEPLVWSDGTPVTAEDSLFSYELAADVQTPSDKSVIAFTASYTTTGALSVAWTGIPGYVNSDYMQNVWQPLPRHQLGEISARNILDAREVNSRPLSHGPFVVESWARGQEMLLVRNPHYYRTTSMGLPRLESVRVRFLPDVASLLTAVQDGTCDVLPADTLAGISTPNLAELQADPNLNVILTTGPVLEQIAFGINQFSFDNTFPRPSWFRDARVRQAMALCTDREAIIALATQGTSSLTSAYEMAIHPLYPTDAAVWPYDPVRANTLLDEVGFLDQNGDGIRQFSEGTQSFAVTLAIPENPLRQEVAELFAANMSDCGIDVTVESVSPDRFYADGPTGTMLGRRFDLVAFPWLLELVPNCQLYLSENLPGPDFRGFKSWRASNVMGYLSPTFDEACQTAVRQPYGTAEYEANHQQALRIFSEQLPIIPLFTRARVTISNAAVANIQPNPSQPSELWNIAEWE